MKYSNFILPAGWTISPPYRATWIQTGKKTTHPMVRDLKNPYDDCVRTLPATLTVEAYEKIQTIIANYGDPAAVLPNAGKEVSPCETVLRYTPACGESIDLAAERATLLARLEGKAVNFRFNDIDIQTTPLSRPADITTILYLKHEIECLKAKIPR